VPAATPEKDQEALRYRLGGFSYDEIAQRLGYRNKSGAWKAVERALASGPADADAAALELLRLDTIQRALFTKALGGDVPAALAIVKIIEQRSRLSGLYRTNEIILPAPPPAEKETDPVDDIAARRAARRASAGS
jgi:hypothetical protein